MKKIILLAGLTLALALPLGVLAQTPTTAAQPDTINQILDQAAGSGGAGYDTSVDETGLARVVGLIARTIISLIGIIFVSFTIYGGFLYLTSAGNEEKIEKAKGIIKNGIIGIIIILCAAAIYTFVANMLISGTSSVPYSS